MKTESRVGDTKKAQPWPQNLKLMFWLIGSAGTLAIVISMIIATISVRDTTLAEARMVARGSIHKDILYQRWNAMHGGVYVYKPGLEPEPKNTNEEGYGTTTPSIEQLTLIDPTTMVQQVLESTKEEYGIISHITSLTADDSAYTPDKWEEKALRAIEMGSDEISSLELLDDQEYLRLMHPLTVEAECIECHEDQEFTLGNIRGGISVHVPMDPLKALSKKKLVLLGLGHVIVWLIGIISLTFGMSKLRKQNLQRSLAEEALHKSEEQFRVLYHNSPDMYVSVLPSDGSIRQCNDTLLSKTGYSREEIIGSPIFKMYHDDSLTEAKKAFHQFVETGAIKDKELILKRKDGSKIDVSLNVDVIRDERGKILHSVSSWRDITERKQAQKVLAESNSMRELLLDIITHDLINPASVIYGMSEIVQDDSPENELIGQIHLSSERLLKVLENTTILTQATFGEAIPVEELNLNDLLTEVVDEFSSRLQVAEMKLVMDISQDIVITANPLIAEVFKNYISNAIKYASDGKNIVIDAEQQVGSIRINVRDYGNTIPEQDREKVFTRGLQLDSESKRGRGLGLAIVKRIAEAHGAVVGVKPNQPKGNVFIIDIPLSHKKGDKYTGTEEQTA
ncbi:MAG: PAS domain S-box protein [Candidatus Marinimicrobia bacterium]|nr:PAS domain S-box protein [Candidatus Neomarinimicrobiota bacterium]